jgi:hypothetical protein
VQVVFEQPVVVDFLAKVSRVLNKIVLVIIVAYNYYELVIWPQNWWCSATRVCIFDPYPNPSWLSPERLLHMDL